MITVTREIQCDIGHRIPCHDSACWNVHGHRYRIAATVSGPAPRRPGESSDAMVADFGALKGIMMQEIHAAADHAFLVWKDDQPLRGFLEQQGFKVVVMEAPPTAEHVAEWCFARLAAACSERLGPDVRLESVEVWETPNCRAVFAAT